jgi:hypothetical protein
MWDMSIKSYWSKPPDGNDALAIAVGIFFMGITSVYMGLQDYTTTPASPHTANRTQQYSTYIHTPADPTYIGPVGLGTPGYFVNPDTVSASETDTCTQDPVLNEIKSKMFNPENQGNYFLCAWQDPCVPCEACRIFQKKLERKGKSTIAALLPKPHYTGVICVNRTYRGLSKIAKAFAVGHELGHAMLLEAIDNQENEYNADSFSWGFVMPLLNPTNREAQQGVRDVLIPHTGWREDPTDLSHPPYRKRLEALGVSAPKQKATTKNYLPPIELNLDSE